MAISNEPLLPVHPEKLIFADEMEKWRYCFSGGDLFKSTYLERLPDEQDSAYLRRRRLTPVGVFAAEGITQIRDTIYQHFPQIRRLEGPDSYQRAIQGLDGGVDFAGGNIESFIGMQVLIELLLMGKVGVYVDMPEKRGNGLLSENPNHRPYIYMYRREDIINWIPDTDRSSPNSGDPTRSSGSGSGSEFQSVLLQDNQYSYDDYGFPKASQVRKRRIFRTDEGVFEQIWDAKQGFRGETARKLDIDRVPFVLFEISDSLMRRVADHQIALLNIESLDINFLLNSNHPFYVEESNGPAVPGTPPVGSAVNEQGATIKVGTTKGRKYPKGLKAPSYIHPSTESMKASIDKQEQIKIDIRRLLSLSLAQIQQNTGATAQGKINPTVMSSSGPEAGLATVGLVLETGEQKIANFWAAYTDASPPYVSYPKIFQSKPDAQRLQEAKSYSELIDKTPSKKGQRSLAVELMNVLLSGKVTSDRMEEITKEIEEAEIVQTDSATITGDISAGLIDPETASLARGYPKGSSKKAEEYQARRAAAIVVAQTAGMGHAANAQANTGKVSGSPIGPPNGKLDTPAARGAPELSPTVDVKQQANNEKRQGKQKKKQQGIRPNPGGGQADVRNNNAP